MTGDIRIDEQPCSDANHIAKLCRWYLLDQSPLMPHRPLRQQRLVDANHPGKQIKHLIIGKLTAPDPINQTENKHTNSHG